MDAAGTIPSLLGAPVLDAAGAPAGVVEDLLADTRTGRPAWALVRPAGGGPVAPVPHVLLRSRPRAVVLPCDAATLASASGRAPEPHLARHFGAPPWDLPPAEQLRGLDGAQPAVAAAVA